MTTADRRVYMVDDDREDVFVVRRAFEDGNLGLQLTEVSEGAELFALLDDPSRAIPDLILLDINMPRMDGFEVLERLASCDTLREIPVIVYSTSERTADREKCFELGAVDFVSKFASMNQLRAWVEMIEDKVEALVNKKRVAT